MQVCISNIISLSNFLYCNFSVDYFFWRLVVDLTCLCLLTHVSMNLNTNPCLSKELNIPYHNVTFPAVLHRYLASNEVLSLIHLLSWRLLEMPSSLGDCHYCLVILIWKTIEVHMLCVSWMTPRSLLISYQLALIFTRAVTWCWCLLPQVFPVRWWVLVVVSRMKQLLSWNCYDNCRCFSIIVSTPFPLIGHTHFWGQDLPQWDS